MRGKGHAHDDQAAPLDMEVSRVGIVISWLAVFAILLVVGAGFSLAVQGLLLSGSFAGLVVAAAFALWLGAVTYRLVRSDTIAHVGGWSASDGPDPRS